MLFSVQGNSKPPDFPSVAALSVSFKRGLNEVLEALNGSLEMSEAERIMFTNAQMVLWPYAEYHLKDSIYAYESVWLYERRVYMEVIRRLRGNKNALHQEIEKLCERSLFYLVTAIWVHRLVQDFQGYKDELGSELNIKRSHFQGSDLGKFSLDEYVVFGNYFLAEMKLNDVTNLSNLINKRFEGVFKLEAARYAALTSFSWRRDPNLEYVMRKAKNIYV